MQEVDGWFTKDELVLLERATLQAIRSTPAGALVEIGVYKGRSAHVINKARLDLGTPESMRSLYLIDNFAMKTADRMDWPPEDGFVQHHLCDPTELKTWCVPIALLHHDADHSYDVVLDHLEHLGPYVVVGGVVALHDYVDPAYPGVKSAWDDFSLRDDFGPAYRIGQLAVFQRITDV